MNISSVDNRKQMSHSEIIKKYKEGEKDFSGIKCVSGWFDNQDLSGINFSDSDLSFSSFANSTLVESNFTNCNLTWSDLSKANLKGTVFKGANLSWSVIIESIIDGNTNFKNADLTNIVAFNTDIYSGKVEGMKMSGGILRITDVSSDAEFALNVLEKADIPESLKKIIKKQVIETNERANRIKNLLPRSYKDEVKQLPARETDLAVKEIESSVYGGMSAYVSRTSYQRKTTYG